MLYLTTTDKHDAQTTPRALETDRGPGGGLYIPFQMPVYTEKELQALADVSFGQCVADVLNRFFACRLSGVDVDFCVGRVPVKMAAMNHRVVFAETWRNPENSYDRTERELAKKICMSVGAEYRLTSWLQIAIRIAMLFGIFGGLMRLGAVSGEQPMDVALPTGDFAAPMAAWYARQMGLPIANIICSCNENSGIWELLHLGELHTDAGVVTTTTPLADFAVPPEVERLIHATFGLEESKRFLQLHAAGKTYRPDPQLSGDLRKGMFAAVVSRSRLDALIPSVYRTSEYILGPYTALAYGGLMDYRAKTGENRPALLLAERSPLCDMALVAESMHMTDSQLYSAVIRS